MRRRSKIPMRLFAAWLTATLVLQLLGYANTRASRDLFTILAEAGVAALLLVAWRFRAPISSAMRRVRIVGPARFVIAGLVAAYVSEAFFYLSIASPIAWPVFMLRTLVWYAGWYAAWWWLCRYRGFSGAQVFFMGGFNGFIVEGLILHTVPLSPLSIFLYPLAASLYGATLLVPYVLRDEGDAVASTRPVSGVARFGLSLLPLLAFVPGLVWLALVQIVFGIK